MWIAAVLGQHVFDPLVQLVEAFEEVLVPGFEFQEGFLGCGGVGHGGFLGMHSEGDSPQGIPRSPLTGSAWRRLEIQPNWVGQSQ